MTDDELFRSNPIKHSSEDLLDRSGIADAVSRLICNDNLKECCTIGILGPWGCGKTSIIYMIRENVEKNSNNVIFINFSPVDYQSNAEDIARIFFDVLIAGLKQHKRPLSFLGYKRDARTIASKTAETAVRVLFASGDLNPIIDNIKELSGAIINPAKHDPVDTVRDKISTLLSESEIKLAIVIDDLDRLMPGEAAQILKLIRITACFDNVYYILGYDENTLSKQIDEYSGYDGRGYLEKFIQVPVHLPEINSDLLQKILFDHVSKILATYHFEIKDITKEVCRAIPLKTMRDLYVLLNRFKFKIGMCPGDICPEDLLALTFIEMKDLDLYNWLFDNRFDLCKIKSPFMRDSEVNDPNNHDFDLLREYTGRTVDLKLNGAVFFMHPHLGKTYYEFIDPNVRKDRIRSSISCSAYFILNESSIPVSNSQVDQIIKDPNCGVVLEEMLSDMAINRKGNINILLDKVNERLSELLPLNAGTIAKVLMYDGMNEEFCNLLPYGSRQSSSWGNLLNSIFNMIDDELIDQFFINDMDYSSPNAAAMALEYLHILKADSSRHEPIPMSEECLSKYTEAVKEQLISLAPEFTKTGDDVRSRMFFVFLSIADSNVAKRVFNEAFDNDEDIVIYLKHNFNENMVFPESVSEIAEYIPEERISKVVGLCDGAIKNMLLGAMEYNKQHNVTQNMGSNE